MRARIVAPPYPSIQVTQTPNGKWSARVTQEWTADGWQPCKSAPVWRGGAGPAVRAAFRAWQFLRRPVNTCGLCSHQWRSKRAPSKHRGGWLGKPYSCPACGSPRWDVDLQRPGRRDGAIARRLCGVGREVKLIPIHSRAFLRWADEIKRPEAR